MGAQPTQLGGRIAHALQAFLAVAFRLAEIRQRIRESFWAVGARLDVVGLGNRVFELADQVGVGVADTLRVFAVVFFAAQVVRARCQRTQVRKAQPNSWPAEDTQCCRGVVGTHKHCGHGNRIGDLRHVQQPAQAHDFVGHTAGLECCGDELRVLVLAHKRGRRKRLLGLLGLGVCLRQLIGDELDLFGLRAKEPERDIASIRPRARRQRCHGTLCLVGAQDRIGHPVGQIQHLRWVAPRGGQLQLRRW